MLKDQCGCLYLDESQIKFLFDWLECLSDFLGNIARLVVWSINNMGFGRSKFVGSMIDQASSSQMWRETRNRPLIMWLSIKLHLQVCNPTDTWIFNNQISCKKDAAWDKSRKWAGLAWNFTGNTLARPIEGSFTHENVIGEINGKHQRKELIGIIRDIRSISSGFSSFCFSHISRYENFLSDALAKKCFRMCL